jgi:uncharacterized protein YjiS (DUF1127 family)
MADLTATLSSRDVMADIARNVSTSFVSGVVRMQRSRLTATLYKMTDEQLAMIGLTRSGISARVSEVFEDF